MTQKQNDIVKVLTYMGSPIPEKIPMRFCYDWNRLISAAKKVKNDENIPLWELAEAEINDGLLKLDASLLFKAIVDAINRIKV